MLLKQDDNANHLILFKLFEVRELDTPSKNKNKLNAVWIVNKNIDMRQQSIDLSNCSAYTKFKTKWVSETGFMDDKNKWVFSDWNLKPI